MHPADLSVKIKVDFHLVETDNAGYVTYKPETTIQEVMKANSAKNGVMYQRDEKNEWVPIYANVKGADGNYAWKAI